MPKGMSLHIGLNYVDPKHYQGWNGELVAAENDANDMKRIADKQGFAAKTLIREEATREAVIGGITEAAESLNTGDIFWISYSGHGGQLLDRNADEDDNQDETWCLYDAQFMDDELFVLWSKFQPGVRILVLSDSCNSGTMAKMIMAMEESGTPSDLRAKLIEYAREKGKFMPRQHVGPVYRANKDFYDDLQDSLPDPKETASKVQSAVLLLAAARDGTSAMDGDFNGLFTGALLKVWSHWREERGNYRQFLDAVSRQIAAYQTPCYYPVGASNPDFENQVPFTI